MALPSSGALSLSEVAVELSRAATAQIALGETAVRTLAAVSSGAIGMADLRGKSAEITFTASNAASLDVAAAFGADFGGQTPKRLIVPVGVIVGPVTIPSGLGSSLIVQNAGEIQGLGGAANGGAGGHAITASSSFTLENTGAVRGGGGGGGKGGSGGQGAYTGLVTEGPFFRWDNNPPQYYWQEGQNKPNFIWWAGALLWNTSSPTQPNPWNGYYRGSFQFQQSDDNGAAQVYSIHRQYNQTYYTSGGAGGNGGAGQGYGQSAASGSAGAAGGTNAGAGGAGGTGGGWGAAGNGGATGANGNYTTGQAGAGGGAAGRAVNMLSGTLTLNNTGTLNGAT